MKSYKIQKQQKAEPETQKQKVGAIIGSTVKKEKLVAQMEAMSL